MNMTEENYLQPEPTMADNMNSSCWGLASIKSGHAPCAHNSTNVADPYAEFYETSQFVTGIILYPIIIVVGLTGNTLTLIVLSHRKMLNSTNVFLTALAVSDILKLLNDVLYFLVTILLRRHPIAGNRMLGYMYPFSHYVFNESVCVSAWLTVSVAMERYIAVCHATRARVVCTIARARIISFVVFLVMSLIAVPSAFRYTRVEEFDSSMNMTMFRIDLSTMGRNEDFMIVYTWIQNLLRSIIPLFVLIVLNALIIRALRKERIKGKKMSSCNRITMMLIVVILVFIICIFPDAIMSTVFKYGYVDESNLVKGVREFTDSLLSLNSAVNFMIYCLCSKVFRDIFCEIFCHKCHTGQSQLYSRMSARSVAFNGSLRMPNSNNNRDTHRSASKKPNNHSSHNVTDKCPPRHQRRVPLSKENDLGNGQFGSVYTGPQTSL